MDKTLHTKICRYCNKSIIATTENFYPDKIKKDKLSCYCKDCWKKYRKQPDIKLHKTIYAKKYRVDNKEKIAENQKKYQLRSDWKYIIRKTKLKTKYGLSIEQYDQMFESQNGLCAICGQSEKWKHQSGSIVRLSVDHCHKTGKIRKLLCRSCNQMIGLGFDSIDILANAIKYLSGFKET